MAPEDDEEVLLDERDGLPDERHFALTAASGAVAPNGGPRRLFLGPRKKNCAELPVQLVGLNFDRQNCAKLDVDKRSNAASEPIATSAGLLLLKNSDERTWTLAQKKKKKDVK